MIAAIRHRGPDGTGIEAGAGYAFGHARLAIIDLETGQQPMLSASGRWLLVFNGEIYNYRELRAEIGTRYAFRTQSDGEVLLAAVECLGLAQGLAAVDGMYAVALLDREQRQLHLARDHFGIKPLYYARLATGGLAFGSEMKALLPAGVVLQADRVAVVTQLMCRFIPAPFTGRKDVYKLRPGEWLSFAIDGSPTAPPRRIDPRAGATHVAPTVEATAALLREAVHRQTVSDVPIGALLSGGVDSALVARFAAESNPQLHSYCVGYGRHDHATEFTDATQTASIVGTVHSNIVVSPDGFADAMRMAITHLEEPVATTSLVPYLLLCKAVAAERKVVLTGQGADEPWAGYARHQFEALLDTCEAPMRLLAPFGRLLARRERLREILGHLGCESRRWLAYRTLFPLQRLRDVFGDDEVERALTRVSDALAWADGQVKDLEESAFSRLCARDAFTDLSDNLLLLGDKLSMAFGLEVRVPMLDVAYASHVLRLPRAARRSGWLMRRGKALHKAVAAQVLPSEIVNRRKKGFETPLQVWLSGRLGADVRARLGDSAAPLAGVLPANELLGPHRTGMAISYEAQQRTFSLWLTNEWLDAFR